jgi:small nuclear ribonucleoprotein (snRNP)-like protein
VWNPVLEDAFEIIAVQSGKAFRKLSAPVIIIRGTYIMALAIREFAFLKALPD